MAPTGLTRDAGWQIGVSRTFPVSVGRAWAVLLSPPGLTAWLGEGVAPEGLQPGATYATADGIRGEVRSRREAERIRLTWRPPGRDADAIVQLVVVAGPRGCSVRFHTERLADAEERERLRARWRAALGRLEPLLLAG